jgi:hypothetical protein
MYHIGMKSAEQVLALVNEANSLTLTLDDVQFSTPSVLTPEEQPGVELPANTKVILSPKPNRQLLGDVELQYDRIDLTEFETLGDPQGIQVPVPATYPNLLAAFNAFYRSALELADIDVSTPLPTDFFEDTIVELKASTRSLAYRGSLVMMITPQMLQLNQIIRNPELIGLNIEP